MYKSRIYDAAEPIPETVRLRLKPNRFREILLFRSFLGLAFRSFRPILVPSRIPGEGFIPFPTFLGDWKGLGLVSTKFRSHKRPLVICYRSHKRPLVICYRSHKRPLVICYRSHRRPLVICYRSNETRHMIEKHTFLFLYMFV